MKITINISKLALLTPFALLLTAPQAATGGTKLGIVNVQRVLAATPGGASVAQLRKQADTDLGAQAKKIQQLQAKISNGGTATDRQNLELAMKSYQAAQQRYQKQLADKFKPVAGVVNSAVERAAKANGYSLVLDYAVAQQSGLVIYADNKSTDLTDAVIKQLKK